MKYIICLLFSGLMAAPLIDKAGAVASSAVSNQSLDITKDGAKLNQVPYQQTRNISPSPSIEEMKRRLAHEVSIQIANDIAYGLIIAHDKNQIRYGTRMYRKVQTAINLLRRGAGLNGASRRSGVPRSVLDQLMKWGQQRPGASLYHIE
ncbi:hypothetical protein [Crocosphaera sp.]|uniref:hypothetical protein n=1 Tax=Crocosphaera sp. TaxID=2729996 RepID=UPI003F24A4E9